MHEKIAILDNEDRVVVKYTYDNIDYEKAIWSGVLSWAITLFPSIVSEIAGKYKINDAMLYLTTAFNSIVTSIANSIINVYWRGDNGK